MTNKLQYNDRVYDNGTITLRDKHIKNKGLGLTKVKCFTDTRWHVSRHMSSQENICKINILHNSEVNIKVL